MADPIWPRWNRKFHWLFWYFALRGFWDRWLRIWNLIFEIQNGGSEMAVVTSENSSIPSEILYSEGFGVVDYEFEIRFQKFKMADPIWRRSLRNFFQFLWYVVHGGFRVRWLQIWNKILEIQNGETKMAHVISKIPSIFPIFCTQRFLASLITNLKMAVVKSEIPSIPLKHCIRRFSGLLIVNLKSDFEN